MGVPEEIEGPVRKRPRLSLRTTQKADQSKLFPEAANVEMITENTTDANMSSSALVKILDNSECIDTMADLPLSPDPVVAPVASLNNLGNTCFLNSVLEVLRYTPGFLDGLSRLHEEILAQENKLDQENSDDGNSEVRLNRQVVKNTYLMYTEMAKKEEQHSKIATVDASSMAVRPSVLLDNIRELNPMFEGHFQHDAQELLRCLLCYIEDAEKELLRWKEREKANFEKNQSLIDIETKCAGHSADVSGKVKVGMTASNNWDSLKGGECQGMSKKTSQGRCRQHSPSLNAKMNTTKSHEESTTDAFSSICDMVKPDNQSSTFNDIEGHMKVNGSDQSPCTVTRKVREEFETVSHWPASKTRKRQRTMPRCAPSNRLTGVDNTVVESTHCHRSRKKLFYTDTSSNSVIIGKCKKAENKDTEGSLPEPSQASGIKTPVDNEQFSAGSSSEVSSYQNTFPHSQHLNISSKSSAQALSAASRTDSSKLSILSMLPFGQIKRLGMRGRTLYDSIRRASQSTHRIDDGHVSGGDVNNSGDVNNNSHIFADNNDDSNNGASSSLAIVPNEGKTCTNLPVILERNCEDMSEYKRFHGSSTPLYVNDNACPAVISSPSKTTVWSPTKSPFMVEQSNEISIISENDVSVMNSTIDSVTRKYFSSLSQADGAIQNPSSSPLQSHMSYTGHELFTEPPAERSISEATIALSSHHHVLEPNKEIIPNPTVVLSPKKQSMISDEFFVSTDGKPSCDRLNFSSGDACLSGLPYKREKDSVSWSSLSLLDKLSSDGQSQFPEAIQNVTASCKKVTSSSDTIHKVSVSTRSYSSTQAKLNNLEQISITKMFSSIFSRETVISQRSPGANVIYYSNFLQPKLEVKNCDWLGVSPVNSISARKAMLALEQNKKALENTSGARRKILYEDSDSNSFSSSRGSEDHTQTDVSLCDDSGSNSFTSSRGSEDHAQTDVSHRLSFQIDLKEDIYHLFSEASNKSERNHIMEALTVPYVEATVNEAKLMNPQDIILFFTRKSPRKSQQAIKSCEHLTDPPNKMVRKCLSLSPEIDGSLKSLSVTVENCDWLLKTASGKPISAKQAIMDIKNGSRFTLKSKKSITETCFDKQPNTGLSVAESKLQSSSSTFIERLFGGTMMHQTKCLECEVARQRQEVFMDISVPVRSLHSSGTCEDVDSDVEDNNDDRTKDKSENLCLSKLIQAFSNVERLIDANKYFCEQCVHHVEAERSCHYLALPAVLTLHLKRFSANSRSFGGVSKLVDKVTIPQNLPCLRYQCTTQCSDSSHKYSLFAIITHSGTSILHGHYRAYVKVQPQVNHSIFQNLMRSKVKGYENQHSPVKVNTSCSPTGDLTNSQCCNGVITDGNCTMTNLCTNSGDDGVNKWGQKVNVSDSALKRYGASAGHGSSTVDVRSELPINHSDADRKSHTGCSVGADETKPEVASRCDTGSFWLECDDECIKVMKEKTFVEKLEERDGHLIGTPYVLFYHKLLT